MKITFTESFDVLKERLSTLNGTWDETQNNKKVLRLYGGVMNWFETTGTIQFQGEPEGKDKLEKIVIATLFPNDFELNKEVTSNNIKEIRSAKETRIDPTSSLSTLYLNNDFGDSEIIIGIVSAVGTETNRVVNPLRDRLTRFDYVVEEIRVSSLLGTTNTLSEYERIKSLMNAGDALRKSSGNNAILAFGVAKLIKEKRKKECNRRAYIINSLKHPDEVAVLRKIYGQGFYLFGMHADKKRRINYLTIDKGLSQTEATELTNIDEDEKIDNGQRTRDTYHLSDFFINFGKDDDLVKNTIQRFLELIFSHPYRNPTFDEFAMFMAFSSSVRSGDLSRQVGAVIASNQQIIATGANDCPASGGGLYWAEIDNETGIIKDVPDGKDYMRNEDSNKVEQTEIINSLILEIGKAFNPKNLDVTKINELFERSRIRDLTEFGRVVHAEMEALLSCSRAGVSCVGSTLYCTTFPCHNCAKHIIAAGIKRVVYVEPYPKSKALDFHSESITLQSIPGSKITENTVVFEPFIGVGARRFLDFFSMNSGSGSKLKRKNKDGSTLDWNRKEAKLRVVLFPESYLKIEEAAIESFDKHCNEQSRMSL